jgi:hypothetical protein
VIGEKITPDHSILDRSFLKKFNFLSPAPSNVAFTSSAGDLSRPPKPENQGGVAHRRIAFTQVKAIARSEQLRDRSVTFRQKGSPVLNFKFEQFIEHTVMFL